MRIAFFFLMLTSPVLAQSQSLAELEKEMAVLQDSIGNAASAEMRLQYSDEFESSLLEAFEYEEAFTYEFSALPKVSKLKPEDESFRLFNWNIPLDDGKHAFRMYVLFPKGKYVRFEDSSELNRENENLELQPDEWYGAIYYDLLPVKVKRETYYTLIGWDGNDALTTKKVLDVLVVEKRKKAYLGFPIFEKDGDLLHRRVFEYAEDVVMNLKWLEPKEMIIFDRLEPTLQSLKGNYAFYGPSTAYDGYAWERDYWKLNEVIDMTRPRSAESGAQFNFPDRPDFKRKRKEGNPLIGD